MPSRRWSIQVAIQVDDSPQTIPQTNPALNILIIRNDKIGDFMLAWPAFALLRKQYPEARITALVPRYTAALAELCPSIDDVLIDERKTGRLRDILALARSIRERRFDVSISLFSEARTAIALRLAGVPIRVGPATKLAQLFLNRKLKQRRSESARPEFAYNTDLVKYFIGLNGDTLTAAPHAPYLSFDAREIADQAGAFRNANAIRQDEAVVIIHPGSGGSAINLSVEQYADLANQLSGQPGLFFVITSGPGEDALADELYSRITTGRRYRYRSSQGIVEFCRFIAGCDAFISGSTGPLHIAGALNTKTVAFYPSRRSATSLRWQTLNDADRRIAFTAPEDDMSRIDIGECTDAIIKLLK